MKKLSVLALLIFLIASCGQQAAEKTDEIAIVETNIVDLLSNPMDFDGNEIQFAGIISHVCTHSGDKMRVMNEESGLSVLVMLGDYVGQITPETEGQEVVCNGLVAVSVKNMEALEEAHEHEHDGEHEEGHECASTEEAIAKMKEKGLDPDLAVVVNVKKVDFI